MNLNETVVSALLLCAVTYAQEVPAYHQQHQILGGIDIGQTAVVRGSVHPKAQPEYDRGVVEGSLKMEHITLLLRSSSEQQAALNELLAEQQDPSSPSYHKWLTPQQYGDRFGLNQSDIDTITSWLQAQGFSMDYIARSRTFVSFSGTADQVQNAFHIRIHRYLVDGEMHFANSTEASIPASLQSLIVGFRGLDDFYLRASKLVRPAFTYLDGSHYLAPDDLATIYGVGPLYEAGIDGSGQELVIVGRTAIDMSDLATFRSRFGLPPPKITRYGLDQGTNQDDDLMEADLDLEWAGAIARNASIFYVYSKDVLYAVQYSIEQNLAPIISMSFGGCEASNFAALGLYESIARQANAQGITWLAASGDTGAAGCDDMTSSVATRGLAVTFPASMPEVTAVGGTQFDEGNSTYWDSENSNGRSALSYIPETSWNASVDNTLAASGGGASVFFPKPAWQVGPGVPSDNARDVPDVSLSAGIHDGYLVYSDARWIRVGGTSASTPVFAGIVALVNQHLVSNGSVAQPGLGNINPTLYRLAQTAPEVFHDITTGNNIVSCDARDTKNCPSGSLGYSAGPGYDLVTGWGSVDAYNLAMEWSVTAGILTPPNGATFSSSTVTFKWSPGTNVSEYVFYIGSSIGTNDISSRNVGTALSVTINGLPADGRALYVRLYSHMPEGWSFSDYTYTAYTAPTVRAAEIISPSNGATLTSSVVTFTWNTGRGVGEYFLYIGNSVGGKDIFSQSIGTALSITARSLPTDGRRLYVRLWSSIGLNWYYEDYVYEAFTAPPVTLMFTNRLVYPVTISTNGTVLGLVNASSTSSMTITAPQALQVSFELVRPSPFGVPLGDPMIGYYNTINNPAGSYSFMINNQIGSQMYFVPFVTDTTDSPLLMDVNRGLVAESRCNCLVPAHGVNVAIGYYKLFSNSNVQAYRNGSNYTGPYYYFDNLTGSVEAQTGILRLTFNQSP
jgi:hypothetical protein